MIKRFDMDKVSDGYRRLPKGAYTLLIKSVTKYQTKKGKEALRIEADIADGEYRGCFRDRFENSKSPNPKWGCYYTVTLPIDDGSKADNFLKVLLKKFVEAIEGSNPGYQWNWDENSFVFKKIGGLFAVEEYRDKNSGEKRSTVKWAEICSTQDILDGNYTMPEDKLLKTEAVSYDTGSAGFMQIADDSPDELPFR